MTNLKQKRKLKNRVKVFLLISFLSILMIIYFFLNESQSITNANQTFYLSNSILTVDLFNDDLTKTKEVSRGTKIRLLGITIDDDNQQYEKIKLDNEYYFVNKNNITDIENKVATEQKIYARTSTTLYQDIDKGTIKGLVKKGNELSIVDYDFTNEDGSVNIYQVSINDKTGYIYGKYSAFTELEALENYNPEKYYDIHNQRGNRFGGGHAGHLDYYPRIKPIFEDNLMPIKVYAIYLNSGRSIIDNVDDYIQFAKQTKINAFVVDIKDNEAPAYKSKVFEQLSPTNYKYANNSFENYKNAINKIKEAGFYVIGRITVFKDKYYVLDNPDIAITDSRNNQPYLHSNTYWPSPFQRDVWKFNVNLAKEAVIEMGFNEIQFDYVRFPDRTIDAENKGLMLFLNDYEEEKAQAIQRFLMYACDELHKLKVYVSADVFGESAYNYVTAYGQYWPAISNVVDVISGMPYPDHFNKYEFGFKEPVWTIPYDLLYLWGNEYVKKRQQEIPNPAIVRNWIQVYDVPNYKHPGGFPYGNEQIEAQIKALFEAGLDGGYMTWLSHSSLDRYKKQREVYSKEY